CLGCLVSRTIETDAFALIKLCVVPQPEEIVQCRVDVTRISEQIIVPKHINEFPAVSQSIRTLQGVIEAYPVLAAERIFPKAIALAPETCSHEEAIVVVEAHRYSRVTVNGVFVFHPTIPVHIRMIVELIP